MPEPADADSQMQLESEHRSETRESADSVTEKADSVRDTVPALRW